MNKIFTLITMLIAMLTVSMGYSVQAQNNTKTIAKSITWTGDGTSDNPYQVSSKEHLQAIPTKGLSSHYKLTANIDLTGDTWTPIGTDSNAPFTGTFDGGGHVISGLNVAINESSAQNGGLFGYIGANGTVKNLGVTGGTVSVTTTTTNAYAGGIVGYSQGTINNCYTTVAVTAKGSSGSYAGGIAGLNVGTISNCYATGDITSDGYAGGIAGSSSYGNISNCFATGTVKGAKAAGIVYNAESVTNCIALNTGGITGTNANTQYRVSSKEGTGNYASPVIPGKWADKGATGKDGADLMKANFISNNIAFTDWTTAAWDFGDNTNLPTLKGFKADQPVKDMARAPFLVVPVTTITTQAELAAIKDNLSGSYKLGNDIILSGDWTPLGDDNATPFTGTLDGCGYTISGLNVTKNSMTYGGLFGKIGKDGTVKNLGVIGSVTVTTTGDYANAYAGGIAGQSNGKIMNCYTNVTVNATSSNHTYAGGIAGNMANTAAISNCFAIGNCTATSTGSAIAGGILGGTSGDGSISYCFATGTVEAKGTASTKYAGGIAGHSGTVMTGCIALNKGITGASGKTNRIAGKLYEGSFANCYASPAISGTWNEIGADKLDGADLTNDNFIDKGAEQGAFIGWSSDNWDFGDNTNLPKLKTTGLTSNIVINGQDATMPTRTNFLEGSIEISASVTYDAETHKDKNIIVKSGGAFTIATSEASLKKLTIEDGGEVVASNTFTCKELLAPRTLSNQWIAYGSPVEMKAVAEAQQTFHKLTGYATADHQTWGSSGSTTATSCDIAKLNLIATDAADANVSVTLTAPASGSNPVTIPAEVAAQTGGSLNTGIFLFCANPTLKSVTIPVAYILSEDGTRFERTAPAKVKPFQSYIVANAATSKAVQSLRVGDTPTANEPVALIDGSFRLWGTNGQLHLSADRATDIEVYNLNGQLLHRFTLTGSRTLTLPRGVYLVRSNNITYKVSL